MLKVSAAYNLRDGRTLFEGEALLTVTKVDGESVTGWFHGDWWDRDIVRALLLNTPCAYEGSEVTVNEKGEFVNTLKCECASCIIATDGDGFPYDDSWWGEGAEITVLLPDTAAKESDRIIVTGLFTRESLSGSDDRHGITSGLSSTTYSATVSWDEWKALEAYETTGWWLTHDAWSRENESETALSER